MLKATCAIRGNEDVIVDLGLKGASCKVVILFFYFSTKDGLELNIHIDSSDLTDCMCVPVK